MAAVNKKDLFDTATRQIIALGGDTDTNACIVCGMIGAIVGIGNIHKDFIASVISYDFKEQPKNVRFKGYQRPPAIQPKTAFFKVRKFLDERPSSIDIKI